MPKSLDDFRKKILSDDESRERYESLSSQFNIHSELVRARQEVVFSPDDIVGGTGISRDDVAKLEGANLDKEATLNLI